jgi:hypothetical protein
VHFGAECAGDLANLETHAGSVARRLHRGC